MKKLAIIYHSAHGHTEHIATHVSEGANGVPNTEAHMLKAEDIAKTPDELLKYDGYILGSPTYLGGVSGPFKTFMDTTGRLWRTQQLKGKLAAGFTVSSLPSGDKQSTLMSMSFLACNTACSGLAILFFQSNTPAFPTTKPPIDSVPGRE